MPLEHWVGLNRQRGYDPAVQNAGTSKKDTAIVGVRSSKIECLSKDIQARKLETMANRKSERQLRCQNREMIGGCCSELLNIELTDQ